MKILFVWPEFEKGGFKPMGIALLSAILRREGHDTRLFDTSIYDIDLPGIVNDIEVSEQQLLFPKTNLPPEAFKHISSNYIDAFNDEVDEYSPDAIAFSCSSMSYLIVKNLVRGLRENCTAKTIVGGIHTLSYKDDVLKDVLFDYLCFGEGETAIINILEHIEGSRISTNIPGVFVLEGDDYISNGPGDMLLDLDTLPFFDWSLFEDYHFWRPYQGNSYRMGDIQSSRGCPYKCLYCYYDTFFNYYTSNRKRVRFYSPERLIEEMAFHTSESDLHFWKFHDSDFFLRNDQQTEELLSLYSEEIGLPFVCNTNANSISERKLVAAKKAGCKSISIGVETGREELRKKNLKKNVSNKAIIESIALCKEHGLRICTSNMIGLPDETEEDIRETIRLNREAKPDQAMPTYFYPFKGTRLGNYCHEQGLVDHDIMQSLVNLRTTVVMRMPQISTETLQGLYRTFPLYMEFPEWLDPIIRMAEEPGECGQSIYETLSTILSERLNEK